MSSHYGSPLDASLKFVACLGKMDNGVNIALIRRKTSIEHPFITNYLGIVVVSTLAAASLHLEMNTTQAGCSVVVM
jgi:hypothetical protein